MWNHRARRRFQIFGICIFLITALPLCSVAITWPEIESRAKGQTVDWWGLGFTVVEVGGLFKVVPEADAKLQTGTVAVGETNRRGDQIVTQVFKLNHENVNNLVPVLRPLISPNNTINGNPGNNSLVITDYADNLQRIGKMIAAMDTPAAGQVEVIPLRHAVAADLAPLVQRLADSSGAVSVPGVQTAGGAASSIIADSRNNSLLVKAGSPARMASIRSLVERLDHPPQGQAAVGNVWVVHLKNADATKLAQVLRAASSIFQSNPAAGSTVSKSPFRYAAEPMKTEFVEKA